jgi:hypothetical protein
MPKPKELLAFGERWRPYRTIASWYMWRSFERAGYKVTNKILPPRVRKKIAAANSAAASKQKPKSKSPKPTRRKKR